MLSRLSCYDLLGSFALAPIGVAVAGPAADASGIAGRYSPSGVAMVISELLDRCTRQSMNAVSAALYFSAATTFPSSCHIRLDLRRHVFAHSVP
jgi:hypothetical protein